jgi:two-component system, OmpR family, alkaline phosphatase synthesis response regulator PhoP
MARVLVVEDSPTIVSHVESVLREDGHEVYVARDGWSALASVRALVPQVVLLDIMLPHSNGFDICQTIRRNSAYEPMKVVMMTSLVDDESIRRAYEVGANGYIKKPFTNNDLYAELEHQLKDKNEPSLPRVSGLAF